MIGRDYRDAFQPTRTAVRGWSAEFDNSAVGLLFAILIKAAVPFAVIL
jgi:hypothetical protein